MRKIELVFLLCVLGFAGLFAARSVTRSIPLLPGGAPSGPAALGAAGEARDVDMTKLKRLLDQRALSDREAEFYEPVGAAARSAFKEEERRESEIPLERGSDRTRAGQ